MPGHTLFLTGHLAEKRLRQVLGALDDLDFSWSVHDIGLQVAALMTTDLIRHRLSDTMGADRVIVPGSTICPNISDEREKASIFRRAPSASSPRSSTRRRSRSRRSSRRRDALPATAPM
jgi:hypothetical protein